MPPDPPWDTPLRFFGALHYLVLAGEAPELAAAYAGDGELWPAARAALERRRDFVARFVAEQPVQTNEVQRCAALLPGFLTAVARDPRPVELVELGASGGLNLSWDRYAYRYGERRWGLPDAPLELRAELRGNLPAGLFDLEVDVRGRRGIDRAPIDVTTPDGERLLLSFVWADQPERLERARRAVRTLREEPPQLLRGDYLELLPSVLDVASPDALVLVWSSASTEYLSDDDWARLAAMIADAGAQRPVAWLELEPERGAAKDEFVLDLRQWPGGEHTRLANAHYHGAWVEWLA